MAHILFLHDTSLTTPRGAELTIKQLMQLGKELGHTVDLDPLQDFEATQRLVEASQLVVVNSTSRCSYEKELLTYLVNTSVPYMKVEYDYNFCVRRNILCTVDRGVKSCCDPDKFHLYRRLFAQAALKVFQSPKHYESHREFYGEAVANPLIMPPTVEVERLEVSEEKDSQTIPFFGDLNYLKGGHEYVTYAEQHPTLSFPVYGQNRLRRELPKNITFHDPIPNPEVLKILGSTKTLLCKPVWPEPSGRLAAEAFLSGCEILGNDRIGTFSFDFYPNDPYRAKKEMQEAPEKFWKSIEAILEANRTTQKTPSLGKVLVYKSYGGLGDIFFCIPAVYKLAAVSQQLDFAVAPRLVDFFRRHLKHVNVVDETWARKNEEAYDYLYELGNYPAFKGYKLPHALKYPTHKKVKQHSIQHYIDTVAKLHQDIDNHLESYPYFERKEVSKKPYFVVHHGAGFLLKIWPTEKYAQLIERLHQLFPHLDCKVIKGPDDPDIEKYFSQPMPHVEMITGGMVAVGETMAGALFHIGNDAGITHVAGAFNVPTVGIYGPTGPGSWGSFAQHNELIWGKKGVCNIRCNYDVILNCEHRICLTSVTVERVLEALYKVLESAYPHQDFTIKRNPQATFEFNKEDCLVKLGAQELLLEYHSPEMKEQIESLFEKERVSDHPDLQMAVDVLVQQHILFKVPTFQGKNEVVG